MEFLFRDGKSRYYSTENFLALEGAERSVGKFGIVYANDGCSKSPDYWRGKVLWPACAIHDTEYRDLRGLFGGRSIFRRQADRRFYRNLRTLLHQQGMNRFSARLIAHIYFRAVRRFGAGAAR